MIMSFRTNRTHLKNEFFAVGALKKGTPGAPFEDDLLLHLGVESIECITFFKRLQFADAIFHSQMYKKVSRNNFTIAYPKGGCTSYGQIVTLHGKTYLNAYLLNGC